MECPSMKPEQMYIAATGTFLPPAVSVEEAVADGRYDPKEAAETQLESVCVALDESAPEMAVYAARNALARTVISPRDISLILHASVCFQGIDFHPIASYIHNTVLGDHSALALEVKGLSNGSMACLELAVSYLLASPERSGALLTTADRFHTEWLDRWSADTGMVMADGAAALILSRRNGFARILSVATVSDPSLERLHRGNTRFESAPLRIDVHQRKREYLEEVGLEDMLMRFRRGLRHSVEQALEEADTQLDDICRFVVPHVGRILLQREYIDELKIPESATTWHWGKTVGHMGAGDQIAGLDHLIETTTLKPGDRCMMLGVGAGFSWTSAVIEFIESPPHVAAGQSH